MGDKNVNCVGIFAKLQMFFIFAAQNEREG